MIGQCVARGIEAGQGMLHVSGRCPVSPGSVLRFRFGVTAVV